MHYIYLLISFFVCLTLKCQLHKFKGIFFNSPLCHQMPGTVLGTGQVKNKGATAFPPHSQHEDKLQCHGRQDR